MKEDDLAGLVRKVATEGTKVGEFYCIIEDKFAYLMQRKTAGKLAGTYGTEKILDELHGCYACDGGIEKLMGIAPVLRIEDRTVVLLDGATKPGYAGCEDEMMDLGRDLILAGARYVIYTPKEALEKICRG